MELPERLRSTVRRYGAPPIRKRTISSPPSRVRALQPLEGGLLGAAGLVWNPEGKVLLVREHAVAEGREVWTTPGGMALKGEEPEETFLREVREEAGLEAKVLDLTWVFDFTVTDGTEEARGFFFQFEGLSTEDDPASGPGIQEARWFTTLPEDMAFRGDYVEAFQARRRRPQTDRFSR